MKNLKSGPVTKRDRTEGFRKLTLSQLFSNLTLILDSQPMPMSPQEPVPTNYPLALRYLLSFYLRSYPPAHQKLKLPSLWNIHERLCITHVLPLEGSHLSAFYCTYLQVFKNSHLSSWLPLPCFHPLTHCILTSALTMLAECPYSSKQLKSQILLLIPPEYFVNVALSLSPFPVSQVYALMSLDNGLIPESFCFCLSQLLNYIASRASCLKI